MKPLTYKTGSMFWAVFVVMNRMGMQMQIWKATVRAAAEKKSSCRWLAPGIAAGVLTGMCLGCAPSASIAPDAVDFSADLDTPTPTAVGPDRETMSQVSTLAALVSGIYDGFVTLEEVGQQGDFGLGTFEHLNGEMIQVADGIYRVDAEGNATRPDLSEKTPFYVTTFFDPDLAIAVEGEVDLDSLMSAIDDHLPSTQLPWAIRIEGRFRYLKTRSVPAQSLPYPPLSEVVKTQPTFEFEDVEGTMVGFRLPSYLGAVNLSGHHFHFLTADRTSGGHVLAMRAQGLKIEADETPRFQISLPSESEAFLALESVGD